MPVRMPGKAMGSTATKLTTSRAAERIRATAIAASVPSRMADTVASAATSRDKTRAWRIAPSRQVAANQCRVKPAIGQAGMGGAEKA